MKFKFTFLIAFLLYCLTGYSQDVPVVKDTSYWKAGGFGSVTFSQVDLDNWAAGGQKAATLNTVLNLFADRKQGRGTWNNTLDLQYGLIKQGTRGSFVKSDDKINLVTKYGYQITDDNKHWFYSGLLDFRTQFWKGFDSEDSLISNFMAPGYLTLGLGVDFKPNQQLSFNYIPLTGKFTYVNDQKLANAGAFGVTPGNHGRAELGSYLRVIYQGKVIDNVSLDTRVELFSNYLKDFGTVDVNWQNTLVMKINKFMTANFYSQLIYDKDIKISKDENKNQILDSGETRARVQFKRVFGVGLSYAFGAKR